MSRLLVLARPALITGFRLAGVDAFPAEDIETAQELINGWLESGEVNLLAIDEYLMIKMDAAFLKRLESSSEKLPFIVIPGGQPFQPDIFHRHRIAEMIRQAVGFHITFIGEEDEKSEP